MSDYEFGSGFTHSSPAFLKQAEVDLGRILDDYDQQMAKNDFKNVIAHPCGCCGGTGFDIENKSICLACEGTGHDHEIHYGKVDGKFYARIKQYGTETFKEYCKACRELEAEMSLSQRANRPLMVPYQLPAFLEIELLARGFKPHASTDGKEVRKIAKVIQAEFPDFMTTNYII